MGLKPLNTMKKILLLLLTAFSCTVAFGQSKMACCAKPSATQQFAMLASNKKFVMSHLNPRPYHFQSDIGKAITYPTADGKTAKAFEFRAKKPTNNWLLVVHEWWGLNDFIKSESQKLYNDLGDVNVLDLDLYDGKIATTREDAGKLMQAVNETRAQAIINGAIA
jgi:carboxymethylenebutenolidase